MSNLSILINCFRNEAIVILSPAKWNYNIENEKIGVLLKI